MSNPRRSNSSQRNAIARRWRTLAPPCWICSLPIRYDLPCGHPLSFEIDEVVPVSKGGSPVDFANTRPAHRCCNQWRSNKDARETARIVEATRSLFGSWASPLDFVDKARKARTAARSAGGGDLGVVGDW